VLLLCGCLFVVLVSLVEREGCWKVEGAKGLKYEEEEWREKKGGGQNGGMAAGSVITYLYSFETRVGMEVGGVEYDRAKVFVH
jgi:hypothetical protein